LEKINLEESIPYDFAVWIKLSSPAAGKRSSQMTLSDTRFKI
jgi:macrodomain Ter protein organizer (MatP/YcbG family)